MKLHYRLILHKPYGNLAYRQFKVTVGATGSAHSVFTVTFPYNPKAKKQALAKVREFCSRKGITLTNGDKS